MDFAITPSAEEDIEMGTRDEGIMTEQFEPAISNSEAEISDQEVQPLFQTAAQQVLGIPELLEMILNQVAISNNEEFRARRNENHLTNYVDSLMMILVNCGSVSRFWHAVVNDSRKIRSQIWRDPVAKPDKYCEIACYVPTLQLANTIYLNPNKPELNHSFISWLCSRFSLAFDPNHRSNLRSVSYRNVFDNSTFPDCWFTTPPVTIATIRFSVRKNFYPGLRQARGTESTLIFCGYIPPPLITASICGDQFFYLMEIRNKKGISTNDICKHISAFMDLGSESRIVDSVINCQIGLTKKIHSPRVDTADLFDEWSVFVDSGFFSFHSDRLRGCESEYTRAQRLLNRSASAINKWEFSKATFDHHCVPSYPVQSS
ncbi:hypothetical protein H072_6697 [Dactylellina haptotyla CBS 200.50]|uniref:F-box domain-containing protein n=1 Tax=Dactylellina haptotyla (strain CBS 200.50) TaxID=1284197 RepID=S8BW88_DACHA|nr:hypothetical protein H072_6697 [Dactylellina haptotyla CBS 200.50]